MPPLHRNDRATYYATHRIACVADSENMAPHASTYLAVEWWRRIMEKSQGRDVKSRHNHPGRCESCAAAFFPNPSNPPLSSSLILGGLRRNDGLKSFKSLQNPPSPRTAEPEASDGIHHRGAIERQGTLLPLIREGACAWAPGFGKAAGLGKLFLHLPGGATWMQEDAAGFSDPCQRAFAR